MTNYNAAALEALEIFNDAQIDDDMWQLDENQASKIRQALLAQQATPEHEILTGAKEASALLREQAAIDWANKLLNYASASDRHILINEYAPYLTTLLEMARRSK